MICLFLLVVKVISIGNMRDDVLVALRISCTVLVIKVVGCVV